MLLDERGQLLRRRAAQQRERQRERAQLRLDLLEPGQHEAILADRRLQEGRHEAEDDGERHI
eukprot:4928534-Prymnesium_polylepis.1